MYTNGGKAKKLPSDNSLGDSEGESRDKIGPLGGDPKAKFYERPKPLGGLVPRPESDPIIAQPALSKTLSM